MEPVVVDLINTTFNDTYTTHHNWLIFEHYSLCYTVLAACFAIVIFVMGFVGNILVIIVVLKRRSMHTTTNCYLFSLALADLLLLLSAALPATAQPFYIRDEWPWGHALCSLVVFVQYLGANASALSITAFTIERYIAICHPMKAQIMCTTERAKKIIIALWCFAVIYCAPWLGLSQIKTDFNEDGQEMEICGYRLERDQYHVYYVIDLVLFYIIPLILTAVLYSSIVHMLYSTTIHCSRRKKCIEKRKRTAASSRRQVRLCIYV